MNLFDACAAKGRRINDILDTLGEHPAFDRLLDRIADKVAAKILEQIGETPTGVDRLIDDIRGGLR